MSLRKCLIGLGLCAGLAFATAAQSQSSNITALHSALHLTASQESAWTTYTASIATAADAQKRRQAAEALFPTISAPRRFDLMEAEMQQELADLHRQSDALKTFYATLTPSQQHIFDTQTLPPPADRDDR
jgi:hypothetical protein